ncbi:MAG: 50S ribosomal protein L15 [Minisyncoccia bacterium]
MQLNTLKARSKRVTSNRVGRGGKRGKTSGHGGKGQTARAGHKIRPQMRDIIKKLPKRRGHGKNRSRTVRTKRVEYMPVNLSTLESFFAAGDVVNPQTLIRKGIVTRVTARAQVKILGTGQLTKGLSVSDCAVSASAKVAIEKAGGTVL